MYLISIFRAELPSTLQEIGIVSNYITVMLYLDLLGRRRGLLDFEYMITEGKKYLATFLSTGGGTCQI